MSKATHKQKLAHANICQRYWHDPVAKEQLQKADSPGLAFLASILGDLGDPIPAEVKADVRRLRTLMRCMNGGAS